MSESEKKGVVQFDREEVGKLCENLKNLSTDLTEVTNALKKASYDANLLQAQIQLFVKEVKDR